MLVVMKLCVDEFLEIVKNKINKGEFDFIPTEKNKNSKRKYGLTTFDIEDFIKELDTSNLISGPELDRDFPGEYLYIFKKEIIDNVLFYVKIKLRGDEVKCLSCHEDDF